MENRRVIKQWNMAAKNYADNQRLHQNNLTNNEIIMEVLGNVSGKIILDAGCGDGYLSSLMRNKGAMVSAFDGAKELIKIAQKDFEGIRFDVLDITKRLPYENQSFDIVVSSLVLMDVQEIEKFFFECHRMLKPNGRLVFSIVHPCFYTADWHTDEKGNRDYKMVENYWHLTKKTNNFWGETTHYHRPLSWYSNALAKAGFVISKMQENPYKPSELKKVVEPHQRVPLFICFECVKSK